MTTCYEIPQFGIVIQCDDGPAGERGGHLVQSDLHSQFADENEDAPDVDPAFAVTEALERTLLALACAGVDLNAPAFRQGFVEAVEHIADQQLS